MSSFFTVPSSRKRKRVQDDVPRKLSKRRTTKPQTDRSQTRTIPRPSDPERESSISGSESDAEAGDVEVDVDEEAASDTEATSEEDETPADRRVRLAQRYLDNIRQEVDETGFDAEDVDKDLIAQRLKDDADEVRGRQFRLIAETLDFAAATSTTLRADTQSTTGVAVCPPYAYTVSKDKSLIKWEIPPLHSQGPTSAGSNGEAGQQARMRPKQLAFVRGLKIKASASQQPGHTADILCVAASPDGRYVATGGVDKKLIIWSADNLRPLKTFPSHRDTVTSLSFAPTSSQPGSGAQLFSASNDRTLKTYSLNGEDSLAYVETLFGHQDHVVSVAAMGVDQCVSVGARDRTARLWRVVDETQLVFRADSSKHEKYQTGRVDCVASLPPSHFVTGSDSGALNLWSVHKKKAMYTVEAAHGVEDPLPMEDVTSEVAQSVIEDLKRSDTRRSIPRAITALATVPNTDVVLSGSWDGSVRVWKVSHDKRSIAPLGVIGEVESAEDETGHRPVRGVINSLAVFERRKEVANEFGIKKDAGICLGLCVVVGIGKEPRMGRWRKFDGRNGAMVFEVPVLTGQSNF